MIDIDRDALVTTLRQKLQTIKQLMLRHPVRVVADLHVWSVE